MGWDYSGGNFLATPYGCIDALKYLANNRIKYDNATETLHQYCVDVGISDECDTDVSVAILGTLRRLGFIYPVVKNEWKCCQADLGMVDTITPAGWSLIQAETTGAIQECFLRALSVPLYPCGDGNTFSPLCWSLAILLGLENSGFEPSFSFLEMAAVVQRTTPTDQVDDTLKKLIEFRLQREAINNKEDFYSSTLDHVAELDGVSRDYVEDCSDINIRYLKSTGIIKGKGRGVMLAASKRILAEKLSGNLVFSIPLSELFLSLCKGFPIPTDTKETACRMLLSLMTECVQ